MTITDTTCRHCQRRIIEVDGLWVDPEADGDDAIWREVCDCHQTFEAEHEPEEICPECGQSTRLHYNGCGCPA